MSDDCVRGLYLEERAVLNFLMKKGFDKELDTNDFQQLWLEMGEGARKELIGSHRKNSALEFALEKFASDVPIRELLTSDLEAIRQVGLRLQEIIDHNRFEEDDEDYVTFNDFAKSYQAV